MNAPATVAARLAQEVAAQRLQPDPQQAAAAQRLDVLRDAVAAHGTSLAMRLRALASWLPGEAARRAPRGVYLYGGVGRGKTLLMDLFCSTLAPQLAERSHFYHFMRGVHAELSAIKQHAEPLDLVAQRVAARTRVLCLDEFFVADIADAMLLAGLLEGLFSRGVTLVATSNLAPQDLYREGLQRQRFLPAIAQLAAHVDVLHLDGGVDYRLRRLEQAPTYLDAHAADTAAALAARFTALTGAAGAAPLTLEVEGRPLVALRAGTGTVWFRFADLCEGPRSQNDYIELARRYHTLFVSDIPVFGPNDDDAARRFIMLIDELYDRGVKTVVSAAAPPSELYRGERLRFEFERAASRLIEMQTQHYLAGEHRP